MTAYNLTPPTTLPSLAVQDAKAQRKLVLDAVRKRRYQQEQERRKRGTASLTGEKGGLG